MEFRKYIRNRFGIFVLSGDEEIVTSITMGKKIGKSSVKIPEYMHQVEKTILAYIKNPKTNLSTIDFKISGTPLQISVWKALLGVSSGSTISYSELAQKSGYPKAIRAVASAVAQNPLIIIIPCHRVVRKNGDIGNYAGGIKMKKELLEHEAVA
jgi:O-6-methylguanine DNA methyltransferase